MTEVWTVREVAAHCGIAPGSVRNTMIRLGIQPVDQHGPGGGNRYPADEVRRARAAAPGKGNRTPRKSA